MMGRYAIVGVDGTIVNVAVWDGVAPWPPGASAVTVPVGVPAEPGGCHRPDAVGDARWVRAARSERV